MFDSDVKSITQAKLSILSFDQWNDFENIFIEHQANESPVCSEEY